MHSFISAITYLFRLIKVVLWSLFGVRKQTGHDADFKKIKPLHLIIVLHIILIIVVIGLIMIAKAVV